MYLSNIHYVLLHYDVHRDLHSFPTRRSSDLNQDDARYGFRCCHLKNIWTAPLPPETELSRQMTTSTTSIDIMGLQAQSQEDRKSGSAGMPRPISYAVFCLKKKRTNRKDVAEWRDRR